ncbi:MAG: Lysyl endopeptidase, partial [bacterium P3]
MKKLVAILFFSLTSLVVYSQVTKTYFSDSTAIKNIIKEKNLSLENTPTYTMPKFDLDKLMEEDKRLDSYDVPYRFGKAFDVSYSLEDGVWQDCEDGRIWSISFSSRKAQSLNFVLNDFFIPNGAKLFITNKSQNVLYGPVCNKNIGKNGFFLTDIIPGDEAMFFLYEPKSEKGKSNLTIKRIVHGYRFFSDSEYLGNDGASAPCNINVACRPSFEKESHAIGLVLLSSGYELCSGSLLMTTDMSFKPYFLTAFHCIDIDNDFELSNAEISAAENWMFMFNYKKKECDGNILANSFTYNSANFKSAWYCTDFALMEIADSLQNNLELSWLGWDRTGNVPTSGNCIHHPCGDVMKINTVNSSFGTSSWNGDNNHWYINWDEGITQGGSSGAPFLNQNKLVVGQNHGKAVSQNHLPLCDRKRSDGGKFHLSWTGGQTNSTRLSNWLDPENTNSLICQTHSSAELLSISGPEHPCGTTTYSVANLPTGYTVDWSIAPAVSFFNSSILTTNSPQQNQCT